MVADIVIRRRQADENRTASDIVVRVTDRRHTARAIKDVLHGVQRDRGRGVWSDADPEILVAGSVVARLRAQDGIEELVERVLAGVYGDA